MQIDIRDKINGKIIHTYDCNDNSIKKTVENAAELKISLKRADLHNTDLSGVNLTDVDLMEADLRSVNLSCADLRYANLEYAYINNSNLSHTRLNGANLKSAYLIDVNLNMACFSADNLSCIKAQGSLIVLYGLRWNVYINKSSVEIGYCNYIIDFWRTVYHDYIGGVGVGFLEFWKENKEIIFNLHDKLIRS